MEKERINKYLSSIGFCSRREADRLIEKGYIKVNGVRAECGLKVDDNDEILINGKKPTHTLSKILIAFNKPKGVVCTSFKGEENNIINYINYPERIYPIGRLDKDSEGLILLTNMGGIVNSISKASNYHEKEYEVRIDKPVTPEFLEKMSKGVFIKEMNVKTRPCEIKRTGLYTFNIILTQGLNRQIRRMCEELEVRVRALKRIRIMNINLGNLKTGTYRNLESYELKSLYKQLKE